MDKPNPRVFVHDRNGPRQRAWSQQVVGRKENTPYVRAWQMQPLSDGAHYCQAAMNERKPFLSASRRGQRAALNRFAQSSEQDEATPV